MRLKKYYAVKDLDTLLGENYSPQIYGKLLDTLREKYMKIMQRHIV